MTRHIILIIIMIIFIFHRFKVGLGCGLNLVIIIIIPIVAIFSRGGGEKKDQSSYIPIETSNLNVPII